MKHFDNSLDSATSYLASAFAGFTAWMGEWNWMAIGAAILLVARLAKDVPDAIDFWKDKLRKKRRDKSN